MTRLAGAVTMAIVDEYGPEEMLQRLSSPWWFQAFGCVLGFDWHSSGVTTVTCGAMKQAAKVFGDELGLCVAGGKGRTSRKTPEEIATTADRYGIDSGERLVYASRMSAKVDSAALQDGYQLYHHSFFFTRDGQWCVVQQGMNETERSARRYHWLGESVGDFVCEPHSAIGNLADPTPTKPSQRDRQLTLLNLVAEEGDANRRATAALVCENPDWIIEQAKRVTDGPTLFAPKHHRVRRVDVNVSHLQKIVRAAHEEHPQDFETLLGTGGIGPAAIRSLSLLAEIIHQAPPSRRDPVEAGAAAISAAPRWADYSYAHGGKDGTPFPVDRETYDRNISVLIDAVRKARIGENDKAQALQRIAGRK